jgi:hypothetical protein
VSPRRIVTSPLPQRRTTRICHLVAHRAPQHNLSSRQDRTSPPGTSKSTSPSSQHTTPIPPRPRPSSPCRRCCTPRRSPRRRVISAAWRSSAPSAG